MTYDVTLIPGDGIGPEVTAETVKVLEKTGLKFHWDEQAAGADALERRGNPVPEATLASIRKTGLALKGPLTTPKGGGFRSVNVSLRKEFELYANIRPALDIIPGGRYDDIDIVMVRENVEGLYIGVEHYVQVGDDPKAVAQSAAIVTRVGCEGFCLATARVALPGLLLVRFVVLPAAAPAPLAREVAKPAPL